MPASGAGTWGSSLMSAKVQGLSNLNIHSIARPRGHLFLLEASKCLKFFSGDLCLEAYPEEQPQANYSLILTHPNYPSIYL